LNFLSFHLVFDSYLPKKLDKRVIVNKSLFEKIYESIENQAEEDSQKEEHYREMYHDTIDELGVCFYTTNDVVELMSEGDCLCICLTVSRPPSAIADPSKIKIDEVHTSMMSAGAFQEAYEKALKNTDPEKVHGGFGGTGVVLQGKGREKINAVMPLYLFDEHWKYAQNWMKLIFGLVTTLDSFGYTYEQIKTIPFLVLNKVMEKVKENDNEINRLLLKLTEETCMKVYENAGNKLHDYIENVYKNYTTDSSLHTIDHIPNNKLFLTQMYIAQKLDKISEVTDPQFIQFMVEEESRRTQYDHKDSDIKINMFLELVNQTRNIWIDQHINKYDNDKGKIKKKNKINYKNNIYRDAGLIIEMSDSESSSDEEYYDIALTGNNPDEWDGLITDMSKVGSDLWNFTNNVYNKIAKKNIYVISKLTSEDIPLDLEEIGIDTNEKKMVFSIQNYMHYKNADRRKAFENNKHRNPFSQEESIQFLKSMFCDMIMCEKNRLIEQINNNYKLSQSTERASAFAHATSLDEAAGALHGAYIGNNIMEFVKVLQNEQCPLAVAKIQMIMKGKHTFEKINSQTGRTESYSVMLYGDLSQQNKLGWKPSKKNCFRLWKQNQDYLDLAEWEHIFMETKHSMKTWHYRLSNNPLYKGSDILLKQGARPIHYTQKHSY